MEPESHVNFIKRSSRLEIEDDAVQFQNGGSLLGVSSKVPSRCSKSKVLLLITLIALFIMTMAMLMLLIDRLHYSPLRKGQPYQTQPAHSSPAPQIEQTSEDPNVAQTTRSQWESFRLPTKLKPIHYNLKLKTFIEEDYFDGIVEITFRCLESTDTVVVHQQNLTIDEQSISLRQGWHGDNMTLQSVPDSYLPYSLYIMRFQRYLEEGEDYTLHMTFQGSFAPDHFGIYRMQYQTEDEPRYAVASFLSPMGARKVFPCFDEPAFKANFTVTITHPGEYNALSNMPNSRMDVFPRPAWYDTLFHTTPVMSTYLLSFAVTHFSGHVETLPNGVELGIWSRPEVQPNTTHALKEAKKLFLFLEEYSGFKYPLPKLDLLALPEHVPSGMENWGLITFQERILLVDERTSATVDVKEAYFVIAHELSHQWYSNLVTQSFWDELWLKECFASLLGYIALDAVHPTWNTLGGQSFTDNMLDVLKMDSMATSHPILREITQPSQVLDNFDEVIYWKSTAVVRMLLEFIGEETFREGMQRFLVDRAYQNAGAEDIWNALDSEVDHDDIDVSIADMMRPWLQQSGYPLISVTSDPGRGKVTVEQSLFLLDDGVKDFMPTSPYHYRWDVPLNFVTSSSSQTDWISPQMHVLERAVDSPTAISIDGYVSTDWLIVNVNRTGYYRVLYDERNRNRLIAQLDEDHEAITPTSRATLIDDAFNLATAGYLNYSEVFRLTGYMSKERHHLPWEVLLNNFNYITQMLQMTSAYGVFQEYMLQLIGPVFDEAMGLADSTTRRDSVTVPERLLQARILSAACKYGYDACIQLATEEFTKQVREDKSIHPDFAEAIRAAAIADPGSRDLALDLLRESDSRDESARVLTALSSSPEPWVLSSVLEKALDTTAVKKSAGRELIKSVSANPIGRYLAWNHFRSEWDTLRNRYAGGLFEMADIVGGVTMWFNTEYQLEELQDFVARKGGDLEGGAGLSSLYAAIDNTRANIQWMDTNYGAVKAWLDHNAN